jgi:hypothetical protein
MAQGKGTLSLEEALRIAVQSHPSVVSRRNDVQAANARLDAAERQRLPGFQAQTGKDIYGNATTTLRVEQTVWNGGRFAADIQGAQAGIRSSGASVTVAQQEILGRVINAYTDLGRVKTRLIVAQSNVQEHERLAALIGRRVDSQISPTSDGTMANARLAQARAELNQLTALADRARSSLTQALGQTVTDVETPDLPNISGLSDLAVRQKTLDYSPALRRLTAPTNTATRPTRTAWPRPGSAWPSATRWWTKAWPGATTCACTVCRWTWRFTGAWCTASSSLAAPFPKRCKRTTTRAGRCGRPSRTNFYLVISLNICKNVNIVCLGHFWRME